MLDLFDTPPTASTATAPLAEQLRPRTLQEVVGQPHLVGDEGILTRMLAHGTLQSLIFWGPPGSGKTSIARLLANESGYHFEAVSAVLHGVSDLRPLFHHAEERYRRGVRTLMLVDEIHRFSRSQQDVFLPYLEQGTVCLVGATTENPSFALNAALLSRCHTLVVHRLDEEALMQLISRAEQHMERTLPLTDAAKHSLCTLADGDGRYVISRAESLFSLPSSPLLDVEDLGTFLTKRMPVYDKSGDGHYNLISAFHKSLRGSDVDAALYWLARMFAGGESPLYVVRRLVRFASEDIGLADPQALTQAIAAKDAYDFLGSPEGELAIVQAVIYLATAPKSNAAYKAYKTVQHDAKKTGSLMPPKHILNAPTKLMKQHGYGEGYQYDHDTKDGFSGQNYFPDGMARQIYYQPIARGFEREIQKRLDYWEKLREEKS